MNLSIISGRLTRDPEKRITPSGIEVCNFTVAVDKGFGKDNSANFFECVAWKQTADFVTKYFKKGDSIFITGHMDSEKFEKDGVKREAWKLTVDRAEFFGGKKNETKQEDEFTPVIADDEDLPF